MKKLYFFRILFFLFLLHLSSTLIFSQAKIEGHITYCTSGQPIPNYDFQIEGVKAHSDSAGRFEVNIQRNSDSLRVEIPEPSILYADACLDDSGKIKVSYRQIAVIDDKNNLILCGAGEDKVVYITLKSSSIPQVNLYNSNQSSLEPALNSEPGVRMESRGPGGSQRLVIRGSSLRSPFGVRSVKVYWNGVPLTSPDGTTDIEVLDASSQGSFDVFKGPTSATNGAALYGMLAYNSTLHPIANKLQSASAKFTVGSYGLFRWSANAQHAKKPFSFQWIYSVYNGYRENEGNYKNMFQTSAKVRSKKREWFDLYGIFYTGNWGLPGAIDSLHVAEDPRQANAFSKSISAGVSKTKTMLVLRRNTQIGMKFYNYTNVYGDISFKENPYGTNAANSGFKKENTLATGLRTVFEKRTKLFSKATLRELMINFGGEYQIESNAFSDDVAKFDSTGTERKFLIRTMAATAFVSFRWNYSQSAYLLLQAGYHRHFYQMMDKQFSDTIDFSGSRQFSPPITPTFEWKKMAGRKYYFLRTAYGYSPPTIWELSNTDGSFNNVLQPEQGWNFEGGVETYFQFHNYAWILKPNVRIYHNRLSNAIISETDTSGFTYFVNSGKTTQTGIEVAGDFDFNHPRIFGMIRFQKLNGNFSYALQEYYFGKFEINGENLSGKRLTGVPLQTASLAISGEFRSHIYIYLNGRFTGKIPIKDDNSVSQKGYFLLSARIEKKIMLSDKKMSLSFFVGGDNLLNTKYSSFLQWNGFGGRYYNPAAGITFYGGIAVN